AGPASWTGDRYRRRTTLRWGDQGPEVAALQNELIDLGYDLGQWGADGDFGNAILVVVQEFQTDYGLTPVDGEPGPKTRAAMDLALGRTPDPLWISHVAVADTADWIGPAEAPPEPPAEQAWLRIGLPLYRASISLRQETAFAYVRRPGQKLGATGHRGSCPGDCSRRRPGRRHLRPTGTGRHPGHLVGRRRGMRSLRHPVRARPSLRPGRRGGR